MKLVVTLMTSFIISFSFAASLKVCLTGTTVKTIPGYGDAFINGAKLAQKSLKDTNYKVKLETHFYDRTALAPVKAMRKMIASNCKAIIGFSTGNDLLAIKNIVKKHKIPVLSIYGDPDKRINTSHLMTMQPSSDYLVEKLVSKIQSQLKGKKSFLLVKTADRTSMKNYETSYKKFLKGKDITTVNVIEKTGNLKELGKALTKKYDAVIILTRSVLAAKVANLIQKRLGTLPMVLGTKYFGSSALPAFLNYLENKNVNGYFARHNCLCDKKSSYQDFIKSYQEEFNAKPWVISASSFDAVNFLANDLKKQNNYFDELKKKSYQGISGVIIGPDFKIQHKNGFVIHITKEGYKAI